MMDLRLVAYLHFLLRGMDVEVYQLWIVVYEYYGIGKRASGEQLAIAI